MRRSERGQTLIIALIIMGALLTIGLTLSGIIGSHLHNTVQSRKKNLAEELSDSGIRYLHKELINNGADWQPEQEDQPNKRDPDYFFLQPGGPDGEGSYVRISMEKGRALIRTRWVNNKEQASKEEYGTRIDLSRYPGCMILESIGRSGKIDSNDPTTLAAKNITKEEFYTQEARLKIETVKRVALVPLLVIENLFTITNKDRHTRNSEIGYPLSWNLKWEWPENTQSWSNSGLEIQGQGKPIILNSSHKALRIAEKKNSPAIRLEPPVHIFHHQKDSLTIAGGPLTADKGDKSLFTSLTQEWINPNHPDSEGWRGSYYIPNCVRLVFDEQGFVLHRDLRDTDLEDTQNKTVYERYFLSKELNNDLYYQKEGDPEKNKFSGVIFIEGDVGVKGVHPKGLAITVKSKGTIYIEGPLIKSSQSKMALLAQHYICVNPTLFFAPKNNLFDMKTSLLGKDTVFELNKPEEDLVFNVFLDQINQENNPQFVLLCKKRPNLNIRLESLDSISDGKIESPEGELFQLKISDLFKDQNPDNLNKLFKILVSQKFVDAAGTPIGKTENYHFIRAALFPYHVKIQAMACADQGSFFVIPGFPFYPGSDDPLPITFEWEGSLAQNLTARWDQQELWLHQWGRRLEDQQIKSSWDWKYDSLLLDSDRIHQNTGCKIPPFAGLSVSESKLYYGEDRP